MTNVVEAIGSVVTDAEREAAKGCALVSHLYSAVEKRMSAFAKDEPQLVQDLSDLLRKGEIFLAAAAPAITAKGLSLPADSAAFAALTALLKSFEAAAHEIQQVTHAAAV